MTARHRVEKAQAQLEAARDAVFAAAHPRRDVPFSQCLALSSDTARAAYFRAVEKRDEAERAAIAAGKAWRSSMGLLFWN